MGLYAATDADHPDLRAHIIADFAAQANFLGYPDDCLHIVRQVEVDKRIGPSLRAVIHIVKARAYAVRGETDACQRQIELAETAHAQPEPTEGWLATVATAAHLHTGTGHALAALARRTQSTAARAQAQARLSTAAGAHDPASHTRALALCLAQLAALHLEAGELDEGVHYGQQLLDTALGVRSRRLAEHLAVVRRAACPHLDEVAVKELSAELDARWPAAPSR